MDKGATIVTIRSANGSETSIDRLGATTATVYEGECQRHLSACKLVDVFSPNHLELMKLFCDEDQVSTSFVHEVIENYAKQCLKAVEDDMNHKAIIVIRAGEHGAMTLSRSSKPRWFPPFHDSQSSRIVDTTGAGNMFLGGFTVSLQMSGNLGDAAICGTVAASFAGSRLGCQKGMLIPPRKPGTVQHLLHV